MTLRPDEVLALISIGFLSAVVVYLAVALIAQALLRRRRLARHSTRRRHAVR